jgi:hypothetical protein
MQQCHCLCKSGAHQEWVHLSVCTGLPVTDGWWSRAWHRLRRSAEDDVTLATFPAAGMLSAQTAMQHPLLGPDFQRLLQDGEPS